MIRSVLDQIVEANCYYERIFFNTHCTELINKICEKTGIKENGLDF